MTVHVSCPCGQWSQDVEERHGGQDVARVFAAHVREAHQGEPVYPTPRVSTDG